ncbi:MAG TPA: hypothetical protein GXZ95_03630 [Mollicutes bacterium]|nr:hypothetical protein [Mollicutes bacterium]
MILFLFINISYLENVKKIDYNEPLKYISLEENIKYVEDFLKKINFAYYIKFQKYLQEGKIKFHNKKMKIMTRTVKMHLLSM